VEILCACWPSNGKSYLYCLPCHHSNPETHDLHREELGDEVSHGEIEEKSPIFLRRIPSLLILDKDRIVKLCYLKY
jgi:hypothetical protein